MRFKLLTYRGVRYVAPWNDAPKDYARCLTCGRAWDDQKPTALTPAPSGRCPLEAFRGHSDAERKAGGA